jgi:hypothetical protein
LLQAALSAAAAAGYRYVEPYVYSAVNLPINSHLGLTSSTDVVNPEKIPSF